MKAIVLSYDKNHPFCELMYKKYMELWPDCPLTFRIPWNQTAPAFFKNKSNVELIQCDKSIRLTAEALLDNIDDDEWVYWCIDDRVPAYINIKEINTFHENITKLREFDFVKAFNHRYIATRKGNRKGSAVSLPKGKAISENLVIQNGGQQYGFYNHHYCRARVLKSIFTCENFPGIDGFHKRHIADGPRGERTSDTIKHLKGVMFRGRKSLIDFLEPCVDGKITRVGSTMLSGMNIEHSYKNPNLNGVNLEDLRVFKTNSVYRIGDLLLHSGARWHIDRQEIISNQKYRNTLLYKYYHHFKVDEHMWGLNMIRWRFQQARSLCKYPRRNTFSDFKFITNQHRLAVPRSDLLVHIRSGDIVSPNCISYTECYLLNLDKLIESITEKMHSGIKRIVIITAMHYGSDRLRCKRYFWTQEKHDTNLKLFNELFEKISNAFDVPIVIDSENCSDLEFIDNQLLKLVYADNVILDASGFSTVIKKLISIDA